MRWYGQGHEQIGDAGVRGTRGWTVGPWRRVHADSPDAAAQDGSCTENPNN